MMTRRKFNFKILRNILQTRNSGLFRNTFRDVIQDIQRRKKKRKKGEKKKKAD